MSIRSSHLVVAFVIVAALGSGARVATAQGRAGAQIPGMPDMSNAPADIQAIMKKVMSGGIPTSDEAKRLGEYMQANRGAIAKSATAYGDSMKKRAATTKGLLAGRADQTACPARVTLPASLALAPTNATGLVDSIRRTYAVKVDAKRLATLQSALAKVAEPVALNQVAGALLLKGYSDLAILTYVAEVQRAPAGSAQVAWGDLGAALVGVDEPMAAVPVLRHALTLGTRRATLVADLGVAYADLGDLTTATTLLQEAIRLAPSSGQAFDALAKVQSCQGNMVLAARTLEQAQNVDWDEHRQKVIDQQEKNAAKNSQNSDDDATEAAKPFPVPPGPSPFPPPPGGGRPSNFDALSPKIPDDYRESVAAQRYNASMIVSYQDLLRQVASTPLGRPTSAASRRGSTAGLVVVYSISNGSQAIAGVDVVKRRTAAKLAMMRRPLQDKQLAIVKQESQRAGPIESAYFKCDKMKKNCFLEYCRAMKPVITESYAAMAGNARTFIGGIAGLAQKFTAATNQWFVWAGDPEARKVIDIQRRYYLAEFQVEAFTAAAAATTDMPQGCEDALAQQRPGTGTLDAAQDPGECKSRSIKLPFFASMEADCHEMKMSVDYPPLVEALDGATPTLDIRRASADKYGKFFIGLNRSADDGSASESLGAQVSWDTGGWVKGAGPAVSGDVDLGPVHLSGELMTNGLSKGPTFQGQIGASGGVGAMTFAPSVSFGGKY
jgi:tetratricopeptide (TPR) repeat protein